MDTIEKSENLSLLEYINKYCEYVDKNEQEEIEALNIDFDDLTSSDCEQVAIGHFSHYFDIFNMPDTVWHIKMIALSRTFI